MAFRIRSKQDLERELASRGISSFTDVTRVPSYSLCVILVALAVFFLLVHMAAFYEIYAVQLSKLTGDYAETMATVVSHSRDTEYSVGLKHDFDEHKSDYDFEVTEVTYYEIKAVGEDGTEFHFKGPTNYGNKGSKLKIRYSKRTPQNRYVVTDSSHRSGDETFGLAVLVLAALAVAGASVAFIWKRKYLMALARGLYLPVLKTSDYEISTVYTRRYSHEEYAPIFRYYMPDGTELLFQGMWTCKRPNGDGEAENRDKAFLLYMIDPEDHDNNEYFIKERYRRL